MLKKILAVLLCLTIALFGGAAMAEEAEIEHPETVILFTNDVHCAIDANIGYSGVMAYKKAFEASGCEVTLVDVGDAVQGGPIGTLSKGEYIIDIMNYMGYSAAAIGNHEFDYGMEQFLKLKDMAQFPYVSCNFLDAEGNPVAEGYTVIEIGGWKIALVGVSTPETITKSTPTYFQNENGEFIYSFLAGDDGAEFYAHIQQSVDEALESGVDYVIALTHLGVLETSSPFNSNDVILNTTGIDCVLDGHSHTVLEGELVKNAAGEDVLLASTGTQLNYLGELRIDKDGVMSTCLHNETIFKDADADAFIEGIKAEYGKTLAEVIGKTEFPLCAYDPATEARIVRSAETNLGDLCADAYRAITGADVAIVNGGGIRADIPAGDITYENILTVHPFGNAACVAEVTGQVILDALEFGVKNLPEESGGFWQVSGMTYEINTSVASSVVMDENNMFISVDGDRRVQNVLIGSEPLDPSATYTLAGLNYHIKNQGDGMTMFKDCKLLQDEIMLDNQVVITYITDYLNGEIPEQYADPYGEGRIVAVTE